MFVDNEEEEELRPNQTAEVETPEVVEEEITEEAPAEESPAEEEVSIFSDVNSLLGFEAADEFEETTEGYAAYAKAYAQHAVAQAQEAIKEKMPVVYDLMQHLNGGGKPEEFFARNSSLPGEITEENESAQEAVMRKVYAERGVSASRIERMITLAKEEGTLYEESKELYDEYRKKERDAAEASQQASRQTAKQINDNILSTISSGKIGDWNIPEGEKKAFSEEVFKNLYFDGKQWYMARPVDPNTIGDLLKTEYLRFNENSLEQLIERKSRVNSVRKLKSTTKTNTNSSASERSQAKGLGEIW